MPARFWGETDTVSVATGAGKTLQFVPIDVSGLGDNTLVAAVPSLRIKVISYLVVADLAVAMRFKSGPSTNLSGAVSLLANGSVSAWGQPYGPVLQTGINEALVLNLGTAVGVRGHLCYFTEA